MTKYFGILCGDIPRVQADLKRFAEQLDRRSYALIRFCMADDSDYKKVCRSSVCDNLLHPGASILTSMQKEVLRRADGLTTTTGTLTYTLQALLYKVANTIYNRSHIHPIMEISQSADDSLSAAANELLKVVSSHRPGVFKAHIQELCRVLQDQAPRGGRENEIEALDSLKACASFAKRFPKEVSNDPKFVQALIQYAIRGTPAACAKYATAIIMRTSAKKELNMQNLLKQCLHGFVYGTEHFMARLAAMSQLMLSAETHLRDGEDVDPVIDIAIKQVLSENRTSIPEDDPEWLDQPDEECEAKSWALKLLVNRLKSFGRASAAQGAAKNVYTLLNRLIVQEGELITGATSPKAHRSWLLLQASIQMLKLSSTEDLDRLLTPKSFNRLAILAQFPNSHVRQGFVDKIRKYIGQGKLPSRFYAITFLLAFEPSKKLRADTVTWLKARAQLYAKASKSTTFEAVFARLISLLAHHPDFESTSEELKTSARYILFYLQAVASEDNIPLIYHYAQRVKGVIDAIDPDKSENLYVVSELAQILIGHFADNHGWSMQSYTGKVGLPGGLFDRLPTHEAAQEIATKQFLPQELVDDLEGLVKDYLRTSKKVSYHLVRESIRKQN
jgi:sister-chromatid-cohesion protein PDS5